MECPECHTELHARAKYCGCGWRYSNNPPPAPSVPCAYETCSSPAFCKIDTGKGWANLCHSHYDQHFSAIARTNLENYGMGRKPGESMSDHGARMRRFVVASVRAMAAIRG